MNLQQVVAPVRESCAQVVGVACLHLEPVGIVSVVRALLQLVNYPKDIWEVKHGGLLGIKYVLAVRQVGVGCLLVVQDVAIITTTLKMNIWWRLTMSLSSTP